MTNGPTTTQGSEKMSFDSLISKIKDLFKKNKDGGEKSKAYRKVFTFTRKDSIISICISLAIIAGAVLYTMEVLNTYKEINNKSDDLKLLSTYNLKVDQTLLSSYAGGDNIIDINTLESAYDVLEEEIKENKDFSKQQKNYYEILLQNIYLPSLNVWKDPYTKNFDMTVVGQKYLDNDKYQNLFLIQYRSDFIKYVGNDSDYNNIENISIGEKVEVEGTDFFYTPISISFSSPSKRSFLLLVNKLSITSNKNNISLLNEFFFYLLQSIKKNKESSIDTLMQKYWEDFSSSSNREYGKEFEKLTEEQQEEYKNRVIGYELYHWISGGNDNTSLVDDKVIADTIMSSAHCDNLNTKCFYDFRDKYRNIPYLAYKVALEKQSNRTEGLLNFLRDLPPVVAIKDFWFEKHSNSSFLNNMEEQYEGQFTFNAYGRNITTSELEEAGSILGKLCFGEDENITISPKIAVDRIGEVLGSLGGSRETTNVSALDELKGVFEKISQGYDGMTNYNKMIKLFELWRMMNDANLCYHH